MRLCHEHGTLQMGYVHSHTRREQDQGSGYTFVGSRISAAYLPQGRWRTPRYLTLPVAPLLPPDAALREAPGLAPFLMPSPDFLVLAVLSWLDNDDLPSTH